ncbi:MAG: VOC family protein [Candidatus Rokubacteria bacterium]|nr:VOC family protein [Candidatus Rokubacteria bacterium]MBI3824501.1 VOC family protein [Candidatus Rokubacteria bacterium]
MQVRGVGHVVLKVKSLERAVAFYRDVIGLKEVARFRGNMAFFSASGNHHDLAVLEVGEGAPVPAPAAVGLYHVALKIGDSLQELRAAKSHLEAHGVEIRLRDHKVSQSIYLTDPDGNGLELFVDADPAIWRSDPTTVAHSEPLAL